MEIDFVLPWVDGNDPEWRKLKSRYSGEQISETDGGDCRYRDWDILKYWFRAVEVNAPWVRKIHFVTCGQVPDFLNTKAEKLQLVNHTDYIPQEYLPTFSSHCIELNMHRIPELSEHFVYFNDDVFLNQPVSEHDFFRNGLPCYRLMYNRVVPPSEQDSAYTHARYNQACILKKRFGKNSTLKAGIGKIINPRYGPVISGWNLLCLFRKDFFDYEDFHVATPYKKSTLAEVWNAEQTVLDRTSRNRFRGNTDVNQRIFQDWDFSLGRFSPSGISSEYYEINSDSIGAIESDLVHGGHALLCLNDDENSTDFESLKEKLIRIFEEKYPRKSSFEL